MNVVDGSHRVAAYQQVEAPEETTVTVVIDPTPVERVLGEMIAAHERGEHGGGYLERYGRYCAVGLARRFGRSR